jgi:DNA-binding SARP family transcriptional activator/DNA-binding beta-propeller fold protein YncE
MEYRILGPLEVTDDGRTIRVAGAKQRALLAVLLVHANEVVSRDRLIDELWGDHPPDTAAAALQVHVSQLRKALERRDDADGEPETYIVTKPPRYVLRVRDGEVDLHRFEHLVREGRNALRADRPEVAASHLREALALWRGAPLAEFDSAPSVTIERSRLEELRLAALEDRVEAELRLGEHATLIPELEALVREHGLRERLRGQLMLALYRAGRQADALDAYRDGRRLLTEELGLEPGDELRKLERAILAQDPALAPPAAPLVQRLAVAAGRRSRLVILAGAIIIAGAAAALGIVLATGSGNARVTVTPNSVAAVDVKSGRVVADVPIGGRPVGIAVGEDAVWVTNADDGTLLRIDPRTHRVVETIGLGGDVNYVDVGFGSVWVAGGNDETLFRVDPERNAVEATLRFGTADPLAPEPVFFVTVGEKAVWITRGNRLLGIDPRTNDLVADLPVETPLDIDSGGGDVWVTTEQEHLIRIDEASRVRTATAQLPFVAAAPVFTRGELWLLLFTLTPQVWRLEPSSLTQTGAVALPSGYPSGLAAGGADLWVIDHASGVLSRIDRAQTTSAPVAKIGWHPISVAATQNVVWVGVQRDEFK